MLVILCVVIGARLAGAQEPPAAKSPATKTPELAAQIELLETHVRFEANGDSRKEVHARVHINNEFGVPQFARLNFDYNRAFQQVEIPLVRITHASGGTAEILPSAITDQPNPAVVNAPAYQDVRVKSVRILGLAPGDNLEYRVITTTTHHPLAPDFWLDHTFDRSGVVSHEIFELDIPASHVQIRINPDTPASIDKSGDGDAARLVYRWEIEPAGLKSSDAKQAELSDVALTTFSSWGQLARRLLQNQYTGFGTWIYTKAEEKIQTRHPRGSPQSLYDLVSQKITTVYLPVESSASVRRGAEQVLDSGYGTPEEKVRLLLTLMTQNTERFITVVYGETSIEKALPRPNLLSGFLLGVTVGRREYFLDPGLEVAPFGVVPSQLRGRKALKISGPVADVSDPFTTIPVELPFPSFQHVSLDAVLAADGALSAKVKYVMRGDSELLLRVAFHQAARDKWNEVAQLLALSDGFRGKVTRVTASDPYDTKNPFTVEYEITQPKFVDWSKTPVRIPALLPVVGLPSPSAKTEAGGASGGEPGAIELGTPLDVDTRVALHLPPETSAEVPTGTSVARDYAKFASEYTVNGATITASRHLTFLLREVLGSRAADYNAFVRAVQTDEAQEFRLNRAAPADTKSGSKAP